MNLTIKELNSSTLNDYLDFFDNLTFDEHPHWKYCYCYSYHFTGTPEEWRKEGRNREKVIELVKKNHMRGYLAFLNGRPIGWVNANDKDNYERLKQEEDLRDEPQEKVCSVVCFVISPEHRRKGVATRLLERVCSDYKAGGYQFIEAYPENNAVSSEDNYNGPKSLYRKMGFLPYKTFREYEVVRKAL